MSELISVDEIIDKLEKVFHFCQTMNQLKYASIYCDKAIMFMHVNNIEPDEDQVNRVIRAVGYASCMCSIMDKQYTP